MGGPTPAELMGVWERGAGRLAADRALIVLEVAGLDGPGRLPVSARDRALCRLYAGWFGATVRGRAECPECRQAVEVAFDAAGVGVLPPVPPFDGETRLGDLAMTWRAPVSADIAAAAHAKDPVRALVDACARLEGHDGAPLCADELESDSARTAAMHILASDPDALTTLELVCPACAHGWVVPFDILTHLWAHLERHMTGLLEEVAVLARRFGWSEQQILALPAWRRQWYLAWEGG